MFISSIWFVVEDSADAEYENYRHESLQRHPCRCHHHVMSILLISQFVKMLYNQDIVLYQCLNGPRGPDKQKIALLLGE